jgi:hypothetical protein
MLRLVGGNNLLHEFVRDAAVDVSTGRMNTPTKLVKFPTALEGPFATFETWKLLEEVTESMASTGSQSRGLITLATQLIERAYSSQGAFKFFAYWVSLEVAADTHSSGKIITLLSNAYAQSRAYIQNNLGFQQLWQTRTAVFHSGENYDMPPDVERYIQCLFLDVVREKLELDCNEYMAAMVLNGFDVTRLDRTVAQANILTVDAT